MKFWQIILSLSIVALVVVIGIVVVVMLETATARYNACLQAGWTPEYCKATG